MSMSNKLASRAHGSHGLCVRYFPPPAVCGKMLVGEDPNPRFPVLITFLFSLPSLLSCLEKQRRNDNPLVFLQKPFPQSYNVFSPFNSYPEWTNSRPLTHVKLSSDYWTISLIVIFIFFTCHDPQFCKQTAILLQISNFISNIKYFKLINTIHRIKSYSLFFFCVSIDNDKLYSRFS